MISRNNYFTHYNKDCYLLKCNVFNRHGIAIVGAPTWGRPSDYGDDKQHDQYELCPGFTRAPHVEAPTKKALPSGGSTFH